MAEASSVDDWRPGMWRLVAEGSGCGALMSVALLWPTLVVAAPVSGSCTRGAGSWPGMANGDTPNGDEDREDVELRGDTGTCTGCN